MVIFFRGIALFLLAYLIGSLPTGYFFTRIFSGIDLRNIGSGTVGASNTARALGPAGFLAVFLADLGKAYGCLAAHLGFFQDFCIPSIVLAIALVLGNIFSYGPLYPRGKGVSTALGALLFFNEVLFFIFVAVWFGTICLCRIPTCASLTSSFAAFLGSFLVMTDNQTKLFLVVLQPILFYTHRVVLQKFLSYENIVCYLKLLLKRLPLLKK